MANRTAFLIVSAALIAAPGVATAQPSSSGDLARFQAGYGAARYQTGGVTTGSTRDENGNRLIVNGLIQSGASAYSQTSGGAATSYAGSGSGTGIAGSTAIGNSLNVVVQGNWNTVIVNSRQTNNGDVTAGTALNGKIDLDD